MTNIINIDKISQFLFLALLKKIDEICFEYWKEYWNGYFEYGCVYLEFVKNEAKSANGELTADGFFVVDLYVGGKKKQTKIPLVGDFGYVDHEERLRGGTFTHHVVSTSRNYSLSQLAKVLSGLGEDGWDVIEYKTNNDPAFGQALLKRRIQKET